MTNEPSSAENFYNELLALKTEERFARLERMLDDPPESESVWLEFKGAGHIASVGDRKSDADKWLKAEWSKYLSAFGNSGAGIVIWGISSKRDPVSHRDIASCFEFVREPEKFKSRLDDLVNDATYPPVPSVTNMAIVNPSDNSGRGCVVSYIPNCACKPHRAEHGYHRVSPVKSASGELISVPPIECPDARYYTRADDDCHVLAPEMLRYLFHPKVQPILTIDIRSERDTSNKRAVSFWGSIRNIGTGTAREPVVLYATKSQHVRLFHGSADSTWGFAPITNDRVPLPGAKSVHPGLGIGLFFAQFEVTGHPAFIDFEFQVFSVDTEPRVLVAHFGVEELTNPTTKTMEEIELDYRKSPST